MGDSKFRSTGRRTTQGPYRNDERARKREEGDIRNEVWRELSPTEQLRSLKLRRGDSKRQCAKLNLSPGG